MLSLNYDLGIRLLLTEWKSLFSPKYLAKDLIAGAIVACVAIPLSLAIALASGVSPEVGLITAIVAGIVCAIFGGTPLAVSGPAAAMAVLIASVVQHHGLAGLLVICFGCGILQLITGFLGLGNLVRFVPTPVVMGFTAGIGAIILIGQLPRIFGLPAPNHSDTFSVIMHITKLAHEMNPAAFVLALSTLAITFISPKVWPRLPAPLFAVIIPSLAAYFLHLDIDIIGSIPNSLPMPKLPTFTSNLDWTNLIFDAFVVYALASLETLLSSGSVDQLTKGKEHDPNQELIGQGMGNMAVALFGGIPTTAVIARSALNVQAGAKTRRSAIFHSLILLAAIYIFSTVLSHIPIAVLAGILFSVALRMCNPREFLLLWKHAQARVDAVTYLLTFLTIVALGLMAGIQAGIAVALLLAAIRLSQINITLDESQYGPAQIHIVGPLTFLSAPNLHNFRKKVESINFPQGVIFDLRYVSALDATGAEQFVQLVKQLHRRNLKVVLYGLHSDFRKTLYTVEHDGAEIAELIVADGHDVNQIFGTGETQEQSINRLKYGVEQFKRRLHKEHKKLFETLAKVQTPHTLFITCCDSRIDPNLITSTHPGELFIVRNIGNIVPPFGDDGTPAEGAAVEYAVGLLGVKHIIICCHSQCGAMQAFLQGNIFSAENQQKFPSVAKWLNTLHQVSKNIAESMNVEAAAKLNAVIQLERLKTYPVVKERLENNTLTLHAWYYDIGAADLQQWDEVLDKYVSFAVKAPDTEKYIEAGVQYQVPFK